MTKSNDSIVKISDHAGKRMKERLNLKKSSQERIAVRAFKNGISESNIPIVKDYINTTLAKTDTSSANCCGAKVCIYNKAVYIFKLLMTGNLLVTAYPANKRIVKALS